MSNATAIDRRLAAVFAADVEGYSRLMGADEVSTLRGLTERRAILDKAIADHRGRIANTAGDSVLAEFGSAVEAVQCATEVQAALAEANADIPNDKRINFRIGIHVGDVMVRAGDLFGDGVNIAARLQTLAQPGGVCVSSVTYDQVRKVLPVAFSDLGSQQLKNIEEPLRVYALNIAGVQSAASEGEKCLPLPDKPSIAVLPFENMSGDSEQDYFADGMVEDITTALSHFKSLFVIARNSSFAYRGKTTDIKTVGRELGVRYVLEGSVRRAGDRIRITGQLIEAATGIHLWADKFDGTSQDVFELQDSVTSQVVGVIAPKIERVEIEYAKRRSTENLEAYDYYLRGFAKYEKWTNDDNEEAMRLFFKAAEIDPSFAAAISWLGWTYGQRIIHGWSIDPKRDAEQALLYARSALETAKDDAGTLCQTAMLLTFFSSELDAAVSLVKRALRINPNHAWAWICGGWVQLLAGNLDAAIEHELKALRLNPYGMLSFMAHDCLARAYFLRGQTDEARNWAEKAVTENPAYLPGFRTMAAIEATSGNLEKAKQLANRVLERSSNIGGGRSTTAGRLRNDEHRRRFVEALRLAGLPG